MGKLNEKAATAVDVYVEREGSLYVFELNTDAARDFVDTYCLVEDWQWLGPKGLRKFAADHRPGRDLIPVLREHGGLIVEAR